MNVSGIATMIFFGVYGINYFAPFAAAGIVLAVSALVIAVALLIAFIRAERVINRTL